MKKKFSKFLKKVRLELAIVTLSIITIIAFIPVFTYLVFAKDLKSKDNIMNRNNTGLVLLDRNNKPFFTFYEATYKQFVPLDSLPKHLTNAIITGEDREFYSHDGFSIRGILRSLYLDIKGGEVAYGGSTITQQLVKNALLNSRRSFMRKYQEIVLAQEIERRYSKKEILEMYLNSVYFGEGAFGIEQAARKYFGKNAADLTIAESALLAGILPAPSQYSPLNGSPEEAKKRQLYVLSSMRELGYITQEDKEAAEKKELVYKRAPENINGSGTHFALMVREQLVKQYGEERISRSGFRVKTSIDIGWQKYAEQVVAEQVKKLTPNNVSNGSAVAIDPKTGEVRVLVGSRSWFDEEFGKVNVATSLRSPGSAFKPIIYAAAMEKKLITPATPLRDVPTTFDRNYRPQNYDRRFRGTVLTRRALANSLNVPAVEIMHRLGVPAGLEMAERLGISSLKDPSNYGLSLVLGTGEVKLLELTNVYATFANSGAKNEITTILSITNKQDEVVYAHKPKSEQVLSDGVAYLISSILSDNKARAEVFGNALTVSRPAAVKTGTGEDYKDALTVGYTPNIAVGVWVGNNDNKPMDRIAGSLGAAPIWRSLIERYSQGTAVATFTPPSSVSSVSVCSANGLLARNGIAGYTEYFLSGTEPKRVCFIPKPTSPPGAESTEEKKDENNEEKKENNGNGNGNDKERGRGGPDAQTIDEIQQQIKLEMQQKIDQQLQEMRQQMDASIGAQ